MLGQVLRDASRRHVWGRKLLLGRVHPNTPNTIPPKDKMQLAQVPPGTEQWPPSPCRPAPSCPLDPGPAGQQRLCLMREQDWAEPASCGLESWEMVHRVISSCSPLFSGFSFITLQKLAQLSSVRRICKLSPVYSLTKYFAEKGKCASALPDSCS